MPHRLELVRPHPDPDTVDTLRTLLEKAEAGQVSGIAYVVLEAGDQFTGDVVGRAKRKPHLTAWLLRALEGKITPSL